MRAALTHLYMRIAVLAATSALAHSNLSPYNMTKAICFAQADNMIDNAPCHQKVFDALVQAEVDALAAARRSQITTDASAATVAATSNALAWAYQNVVTTLENHGANWKW